MGKLREGVGGREGGRDGGRDGGREGGREGGRLGLPPLLEVANFLLLLLFSEADFSKNLSSFPPPPDLPPLPPPTAVNASSKPPPPLLLLFPPPPPPKAPLEPKTASKVASSVFAALDLVAAEDQASSSKPLLAPEASPKPAFLEEEDVPAPPNAAENWSSVAKTSEDAAAQGVKKV